MKNKVSETTYQTGKLKAEIRHIHAYAAEYNCTLHDSFVDWIFEDYMTREWYEMLLQAMPEEVQQGEDARLATFETEY